MADFKDWYHHHFGKHTPGDEESPALVTSGRDGAGAPAVDADHAGRGQTRRPARSRRAGPHRAGRGGDELYLLLNGVLAVEVDGEPLAEVGPGACSASGPCSRRHRTSTLRAVTPVGGGGAPGRHRPRTSSPSSRRATAGKRCADCACTSAASGRQHAGSGPTSSGYGATPRASPWPATTARPPSCSTPAPACATSPRCWAASPIGRLRPGHLHWDHTPGDPLLRGR